MIAMETIEKLSKEKLPMITVLAGEDLGQYSQAKEKFENLMCTIRQAYNELASMDIPKEDARYVLPNATETKIIVTMNARSLFNFFSLRCCTHAQWEIRQLANLMLCLLYTSPSPRD